MEEIAKLREEHAQLVRLAQLLASFIDAPTPPAQVQLFQLRSELASTLIGHVKTEDWVLYPRLLTSTDERIAATARAFSDEMGGLAAAFAAYSERWTAGAIAADWPAYCEESRAIIEALTNRIMRENRELYPLLDKLDRAA